MAAIDRIYRRIFKIWRARRFALFLEKIRPQPGETLLDIGGYPGFWLEHPQSVARIDLANTDPIRWDNAPHPNHHIRVIEADGCALPFKDQAYDIVFSNSTIEHVGDFARQEAFAREMRRVGRRLWMQTPAYECPLEPHYLAPLVHYLPHHVQRRILRNFTPWGWLRRPTRQLVDFMVDNTRILRRDEVQGLFPDCHLLTEPLLPGIPKGYVALRTDAKANHG